MTAPRPSTIVFALDGRVARADVPSLCDRMHALLEDSGAGLALCDVGGVDANAVTIDALARLQLTARRLGRQLRLQRATDELLELLSFTGLNEVLRVEPSRQAEQREERLGVEEERELDDPAV
jgi:ABC-type transporter Mla MlaB component